MPSYDPLMTKMPNSWNLRTQKKFLFLCVGVQNIHLAAQKTKISQEAAAACVPPCFTPLQKIKLKKMGKKFMSIQEQKWKTNYFGGEKKNKKTKKKTKLGENQIWFFFVFPKSKAAQNPPWHFCCPSAKNKHRCMLRIASPKAQIWQKKKKNEKKQQTQNWGGVHGCPTMVLSVKG